MKGISDFFDKFKNKAVAQMQIYSVIKETIEKHTRASLEMKNISFKGGTVNVACSQVFKNEIYIKKQAILGELAQRLPNVVINDIK